MELAGLVSFFSLIGRKYNNELSYNRANSVLKFLKEFGLKNKMEVFGYGSSQQIYDELDEINNPKNRRVEIILL